MDREEIAYNLAYYGDDSDLERLIVEVVARLPEDVIAFVLDRCLFLSVGRSCFGMVLPARIATHHFEKRTRNRWIVLLEEQLPEKDAPGIIAHEIAHALLRHDRLSLGVSWDCERAACAKVLDWGFDGLGADPEHCDLRHNYGTIDGGGV